MGSKRVKQFAYGLVCAVLVASYTHCGRPFETTIGANNQTSLGGVNNTSSAADDARSNPPSTNNGGNTGYLNTSKPFACISGDPGLSAKKARRLSKYELLNTLEDLFGSAQISNSSLSSKIALLKADPIGDVDAFENQVESLDSLLSIYETLTTNVFANSTTLNSILNGCSTSVTASCRTAFLAFAAKALRRPLDSTETSSHSAFLADNGNTKEALRYAVIRVLMSPAFHQHLEMDESTVVGTRIKVSPYEIASRLAYGLTGYPPDATLLNAASTGQLVTLDQAQAQAQRLVTSARGKAHFQRFMIHWFRKATDTDPDPIVQTELGISPTGLGAEAAEEFRRFTDYVVYQKEGDFRSLLTDPTIFPYTTRLATLMGTSQSTSAVQSAGARQGILLRPMMTISSGKLTNIVNRGLMIRRQMLCNNIPRPNLAVIGDRSTGLADFPHEKFANRTVVTEITKSTTCMSCHASINPMGFVMESFDPFGGIRTKEKIWNDKGQVVNEFAIDTAIDDLNIYAEGILPAANPVDMVQTLSKSETAMRCMSQQLFRYSRVRLPAESDGCSLNTVTDALRDGKSIKDVMIHNLVNEELFWRNIPKKDGV